MADINERLLSYLRRNILGRRWQLDGADPDDAFLGKGTYGYVYAVYCEERDGVTGKITRQNAALKLIPVDETIFEGMKNAAELSDEEKQRKLNAEYRKDRQEIDIMEKVRGTTEIAYFLNSKIIERADTRLKGWDVLILMDRLVSLEQYMADHAQTPGSRDFLSQVLHIWRDISTALRHCENVSIIHTDVKPANVLYSPWKQAFVLSDFGEAVPEKNYAAGRSRRGTLDYMAPEMYYKQGGDSRMDMYSLAVMIYEMLNGNRIPFQEGINREAARDMRLVQRRSVPAIKGIPGDVNAALLRCLEYEPDKRYASCKQLEDAVLELYVRYPPGPGGKDTSSSPGWIRPALIGAVAVLAIAAGIVSWRHFGGDGEATQTSYHVTNSALPAQTVATTEREAPEITDSPVPTHTASPTPAPTSSPTPTQSPTPTPTHTPTQSPTPTPTASPTPAPAPRLMLTHVDRPVEREGEQAVIRGIISAQGGIEADKAVLLVNGEAWPIELGAMNADGTYSFESRGTLAESVQRVQLQLSITLTDDITLVSSEMEAPMVTPEPSPTPAPKLSLRLADEEIVSGGGELSLRGEVGVEGELSAADLRLRLNNQYIDEVDWTDVEGGYAFTAAIHMDLEGVQRLEVSVLVPGNADIEPATDSLAVTAPTVEVVETPQAYAAIELAEALDGRTLTLDETLTVSGSAQPDEALVCSVNGVSTGNYVVEADGSFAVDLSSNQLTEGTNVIRLSYAGGAQAETYLEFTLVLDTQGPTISAPESTDQFATQINVHVEDPSMPCSVALRLDGVNVDEQTLDAAGDVALTFPDVSALSAQSSIEVLATDALGNRSRQGIALVRSLTSIGITNRAVFEGAPVGPNDVTVDISALPGTTLSVRWGGEDAQQASLSVDENGYAGFRVGPGNLQPGENVFTFSYAEVDGKAVADEDAQSVELVVRYDGEAPETALEPSELVRGERELTLTVSNETGSCLAELIVDGAQVYSQNFDATQPFELVIPEEVELDGAGAVELAVTDGAGNVKRLSVPVIYIEPITVANARSLSGGVKGTDDDLTLQLSGESGAAITFFNGDESTTAPLSEIYDIRPLLHSGTNEIRIEYAQENGFNARALAGTSATLIINYDGDPPQPRLDDTQLTRDTTQIALHVPNEPNGYDAVLYVDGAGVWRGEGLTQEDTVIDGVRDFGLSADSDIRLTVDDHANPPVELTLNYSNSSALRDVDAGLLSDIEPVCIGGTVNMNGWLLCSAADMTDASRNVMELVDESGAAYACEFEAQPDDAGYEELIAREEGNINAYYASHAYSLTALTIPDDIPGGQYELRLTLSTDYGAQALSLGTVSVLGHEALAGGDGSALSAVAGDWVDAQGWLVGNADDLARADAVTLRLTDANGQSYPCEFEHEALSADEIESLTRGASLELNPGYVNSGWRITRVRIPDELPGGAYTLNIAISTAHEMPSFALAELNAELLEAVAGMNGDTIAGSAGADVQTDIWVLCNSYDFNSEFRKLRLVDAGGTATDCMFSSEKLDDATYAQYLAGYGTKLDTGYADAGYAITGITIPQGCSAGTYSLVLEMETARHLGDARYSWELGKVELSGGSAASAAPAGGEAQWADAQSGYAIGLDAPLQAAFRSDNIVLTGWVSHPEGSPAYFDHCELLDAYGRSMFTSYFTGEGELVQSARTRGVTGGTSQNAGFIISIDASGSRITGGETYTLQIYSSSVQGEAWQTVSAQVSIDDGAPTVAQATLDALLGSWAPAPPAEAPAE